MRVMTFNIRFENAADGHNAWMHRRDLAAEIIRRYSPAVVGTQEGKWNQLMDLKERLPEYHLHAPGRVIDEFCQYPTLFFLRDEFDAVEGGEFWLSETPLIHRSKSWDSAFPRMLSYAKVSPRGSGQALWTGVTHLDHVGSEARRRQAMILADWSASLKGPAILMGDFNDRPDSEAHEALAGRGARFRDTWQALGRTEGEQYGTAHGFSGIPRKPRIDWILVTPEFRVQDACIIRDHFQGMYPSDHFPYAVDLELSSSAAEAGR